MKRLLCFFFNTFIMVLSFTVANAQCGTGYATATANWDNLDYLITTGSYSGFVTTAMAQTQAFGLGRTRFTINYASTITNYGEDITNTAEAGSFGSGADISYNGNGAITITFDTLVRNVQFSLYDIDSRQTATVTAKDGNNLDLNVTMTSVATGIITPTGTVTATAPVATAANTAAANTDTKGTLNIAVDGASPAAGNGVKTITITLGGTAGDFWLSDISACVNGSFPLDYYVIAKPFAGRPSYILAVHDLNTVYWINTATGAASSLFTDSTTGVREINNIAYDPYNRFVYYSIDGVERLTPAGIPANVKSIKRYNCNTGTFSTIINDVTAAPFNMATYQAGVESGGAAFYNGSLYIGVEGYLLSGTRNSGRESNIWRIDFDANNTPVKACQVFGTPVDNGANNIHDWGDFTIKDGVLVNFNSQSTDSSFTHYSLQTDTKLSTYLPTVRWDRPRQVGQGWDGTIYWVGDSIGIYNGTTGVTSKKRIVAAPGSVTWMDRAGDAGEAFVPQADFGDAPASYDGTGDPAVHEMDAALRLGATFDREWVKAGATALANADGVDEDGLPYVQVFNPDADMFLAEVNVYNNTGAAATLIGWFDYDGDGIFEASEAVVQTVPSSTAVQTIYLPWFSAISSLAKGSYTYLRIRLTSAANGMTAANPTGYFANGEVEDYRVIVDNYPLTTTAVSFTAEKEAGFKTVLQWTAAADKELIKYYVQRSNNNLQWQTIGEISQTETTGTKRYQLLDNQPGNGKNYYRLQMVYHSGISRFSETRVVDFSADISVVLTPNHTKNNTKLMVTAAEKGEATIAITNAHGATVYKQQVILLKGANIFTLSLSSLPSGSYIVHLFNNRIVNSQKLIIE